MKAVKWEVNPKTYSEVVVYSNVRKRRLTSVTLKDPVLTAQ